MSKSQVPAGEPSAVPAAQASAAQRKSPRRLGRGLASLISIPPTDEPAGQAAAGPAPAHVPPDALLLNLELAAIAPNPHQPRRAFDQAALASLANSLKAEGLLQPVIVRRRPDGAGAGAGGGGEEGPRYQLVAGERRWRAARLAGLATVPAIVKSLDDDALLELALVENIQREDLNPIERAAGYRALMARLGVAQDVLAQRLAESRPTVANYLRLLELPAALQGMIADGRVSFGQARALMGFKSGESQLKLADAIVARGLNVRQVEGLVAEALADPAGEESSLDRLLAAPVLPAGDGSEGGAAKSGKSKSAAADRPKPSNIVALEERLTRRLGTRVAIHPGRRPDMGKIMIDFYSLDDFDRILDALGVAMDD